MQMKAAVMMSPAFQKSKKLGSAWKITRSITPLDLLLMKW